MHRKQLCAISTLAILHGYLPVYGEVIYVRANADAGGNGLSWKSAFNSLTDALNVVKAGDEVWVTAGVYRPTLGTDREATFAIPEGIAIFGGFSGNETQRAERDSATNLTILDGNIGNPDAAGDNIERVVTLTEVSDAVLDGCIIQNAYNDIADGEARGGGIYCQRTNAKLIACVVRNNRADGGGGLWNEDGDPYIYQCALEGNYSSAITHLGGSPEIIDCVFVGNEANGRGGAFNASTAFHAARFVGCIFEGNRSNSRGGVYYGVGHPTFEDCVFIGNKAKVYGGVAYLHQGTSTFVNCVLVDNWAGWHTGGIHVHDAESVLHIANSILWGNTADLAQNEEQAQLYLFNGSVRDSCVQGWTGRYGGEGNFGDDPEFIDIERENLRLCDTSPCVDAGDDSVVTQPTDLDGNPRILGARVDIGCYESLCPAIVALDLKCTNSGKLKATATTTLPEGATVRFTQPDPQGRLKARPATVNARGKAVAKWRPDDGTQPVCIEGCSTTCSTLNCP